MGAASLYLTCAALGVLAAGPAWAHTTGVSQSELRLDTGAPPRVHARFAFAAGDVEEVAAFVDDGVELTADDGAPCTLDGPLAKALDEGDSLTFEGDYACPNGARAITATYFFLSKLAPGHRHVATFLAGDATTQRLLTATSRAITIAVPPNVAGARREETPWWRSSALLWLAPLAALTAVAALLARRRVVTHCRVTRSPRSSSKTTSVAESRRAP